jgi:phosphatidylglycerol---prolipoprotein diacylglyceryl transferase
MRQILIEIPIPFIGKLPLYGFGLMMCIGFFSASWLIHRLARREGIDVQRIADLVLWIFLWGVVGARALFMVRNPELFRNPLNFFKIWEGGIVFYGGVMTGIPVFILYTRRYGLPAWKVLDILAPGLALGIGIGRFGCLLNGCCWGAPTSVPWAVQFPPQSLPWHDHVQRGLISADSLCSLPVHPTQVYLALAGWLLLILTLLVFPFRRRYGEAMALLMVGYSVTRFAIEFLRGDEPVWADSLTISQNISVALFIGGVFMWAWLRRAPELRVLPAAAQSG